VPIFNRGEQQPAPAGNTPNAPELDVDQRRLRDETDPDPLVEQAAERLRQALHTLEARDEWGRPLAWRQVARIALGPILTQLRDAETAMRLKDAVAPATATEGGTERAEPAAAAEAPSTPVPASSESASPEPAAAEPPRQPEPTLTDAREQAEAGPRPDVDPLDSRRPLDELMPSDPFLPHREGDDARGHQMRADAPPSTLPGGQPAPWDPRWRPQPWRDQPWQRS
jgi:hypothetical protein